MTPAGRREARGLERVALVCTRGFADVLTLGRQNRADPYAPHVGVSPWVEALADAWRFEVEGRIDAAGGEEIALDCARLSARIAALPALPDAIAVCLLFAHANPAHELAVEAELNRAFPGIPVVCSHRTGAGTGTGHGEFERTVAAVQAAGCTLPGGAVRVQARAGGTEPPLDARLEAIADAMQSRLVQESVSSVVREAMDCAAAIFLPDGRMAAQARSLPLLLGSLTPAVAGLLQAFPVSAMREGDGYLSNDPWSGGTHLPDFVLLRPVFHAGEVRALGACILHHQDVGGSTPGSVATDAQSIHQEGLRIPPVQLWRGGVIDTRLLALICANSRLPTHIAGDVAAQWSALGEGAERLSQLLTLAGPGFEGQCDALIAASEAAIRQALSVAPDGDYRFSDALDGDGVSDAPVPLEVVLRKRGDRLVIDLSGCANQTRGPVNASRAAVWAAVSYFARMLAPQAASNHGCTMPIELVTRHGSIVDPEFPAAVNARTNLVKLLANALLGAWAQAVPHAAAAPNAGVAIVLSLSGTRTEGSRWQFTEIIASAAGGAPYGPGGSGVSTDVGNARNTPAEVIEAQAPLRVELLALRRGSGGAGRHRGGDGVVRAYRLLEGSGQISYRGERHATQAQGAAGGGSGASGRARIERADGSVEHLAAKTRAVWNAGDRLIIETAGGGGWGKPVAPGAEFA